MADLRMVSNREIPVTNEQFLTAIFGEEWNLVHVTAFEDDPQDIVNDRRALCWGGGAAGDRLARFTRVQNQYFCISLFQPDEAGSPRRRKKLFDACFVIVADDVKEKLPEDRVKLLPEPSYKLHTSAGSEQWGWILSLACEDRRQVENLLDGLVSKGLAPDGTDPGMKGVTRYVRLPEGSNTKSNRYVDGRPFRCYISEWEPERAYSIEELAEVFDIDINAPRNEPGSAGLKIEDDIVLNHPVLKHLTITEVGNDNWLRVDCPNVEAHSVDDPSGAAVQVQADGRLHFQCHHGHCNGERSEKLTGLRVVKMLDKQIFGGTGELIQQYDDYQRDIQKRGIRELSNKLPMGEGAEGDDEDAERRFRFNPMRYIFIAPENKFYDIQSGCMITPKGLDNLYRAELPPGRGRVTASNAILETMNPQISAADTLGWNPISTLPPAREEIIYEDDGKRVINMWKGLALTPVEGDVSLWLEHAEYLIPKKEDREVVLNYLAALVQMLDVKPGFFLAHRGAHRVGKDLFYTPMAMIFGERGAREVTVLDIVDGWGDYLSELKFCIVTEVDNAQDRKLANALKTVVAPTASGKRKINIKGQGVHYERDCMGGVMMSNRRAFMTIEQNDKRYFVVDSWIEPKEPEYYRRINQWIRYENGAAKVLNYLLQRDLTGFNVQILPYLTDGAKEMMQSGKYDYEQDLEELEKEGVPPFHMNVIHHKALKKLVRDEGLKCGNNGLMEAMRGMGWSRFSQVKVKRDGKTVAVPTFYAKGLPEDARMVDAAEFFKKEYEDIISGLKTE